MRVRTALTIAGSDSGGGAGIQGDLKTFSALGVYGAAAITAVTAQNTVAVTRVFDLPADLVADQIEAVVSDIGADAVKVGMLANAEIIRVLAQQVRKHRLHRLVVDPVLVATSGVRLLPEEAIGALRSTLLPLATVITPNVPEAEALTELRIESLDDMRQAAEEIVGMGARSVVLKGGHRDGPAIDVFYDGHVFRELAAPRIRTSSTHGTGCTLSAAIAAFLALGRELPDAVREAKEYLTEALEHSYPLGHGHGPVNHFYRWWKASDGW